MGTEYRVLSIDELSRLGEKQVLERYYRYKIKTKGGVTITVDIDEKDATPEKAPGILLKKATSIDATLV